MGHMGHGSWVKSSVGHLGHGLLWVTHFLLWRCVLWPVYVCPSVRVSHAVVLHHNDWACHRHSRKSAWNSVERRTLTRRTASTSMYSLTFRVRVMLPYQRNPYTDCNPPNSAQLRGIPYRSPKLHPGPCNSVGMRLRTVRQTQTDRHTHAHKRAWPQYISCRLRVTRNVIKTSSSVLNTILFVFVLPMRQLRRCWRQLTPWTVNKKADHLLNVNRAYFNDGRTDFHQNRQFSWK